MYPAALNRLCCGNTTNSVPVMKAVGLGVACCLLLVIVLPWLLATSLTWTYAEVGFEDGSGSGDSTDNRLLERATAIVQSVSGVVYVTYISFVLCCMCCLADHDDSCVHFCLAIGVAVFGIIPLIVSIVLIISVVGNSYSIGQTIGAVSIVLCFVSTSCCCCVALWALFCGSVGVEKHAIFPAPIAYLSKLLRDDEDSWSGLEDLEAGKSKKKAISSKSSKGTKPDDKKSSTSKTV